MTITPDDIKLLASERLTDYDDGGGRMSSHEVVDGQVNNLFDDISRLDRVAGRVSMRKCFPAVLTDTTETYLGAHCAVIDNSRDPLVNCTLFTTDDWFDERLSAQDRLESYVVRGPIYVGILYGNQVSGSRAISILQDTDYPIPDIGTTFSLIEDEGLESEIEQYVRITNVTDEVVRFRTQLCGTFYKRIVVCEISDQLRYSFHGGTPDCFVQNPPAEIHSTILADASRYYGVTKLQAAANTNDSLISVESIFGQLVPSAQGESAVSDVALASSYSLITGSDNLYDLYLDDAPAATVILPRSVEPGSLLVNDRYGTVTDDSLGGLLREGNPTSGEINYMDGIITNSPLDFGITTSKLISFIPSAVAYRNNESIPLPVPVANRGYTYTFIANPAPSAGTVSADFISQGKWYRLTDQGDGTLAGIDAAHGGGTVDYVTGAIVITCGALPDAESDVLVSWGHGLEYNDRSGNATIDGPIIEMQLGYEGVEPGSVTISWYSYGEVRTCTDNGYGHIVGADVYSGIIDYQKGTIIFSPFYVPDANTQINAVYKADASETYSEEPVKDVGGLLNITLPHSPIKQGSVEIRFQVTDVFRYNHTGGDWLWDVTAVDDGQGKIFYTGGILELEPMQIGTIDYGTGVVSFDPDLDYSALIEEIEADEATANIWRYFPTYNPLGYTAEFVTGSTVSFRYHQNGWIYTNRNHSQDVANLTINLTPYSTELVVPGSVLFEFNWSTYVDRDGTIIQDPDIFTGSGIEAGTIDYATGIVSLNSYTAISVQSTQLDVISLFTVNGDTLLTDLNFRTPGAPLRQGSLSIQATMPDGTVRSGFADFNGNISNTGIEGVVEASTGICSLKFGAMVAAAGNESEPWYDPALVDGGMVWKPESVIASTVRYACVVYSYLPLDAALLGIDPVRLPTDGRVPIIRDGNILLVHNTEVESMPDNLTAGQVFTLNRTDVDLVELFDQDNVRLPTDLYSVDMAAGTVTMADPLDLSAYTQPLWLSQRQEDMLLVSDAQISGSVQCTSPLSHDYPVENTYVSSILPFGDLLGRVHTVFDQYTWSNDWEDNVVGDPATGTYDTLNWPIDIKNIGSTTERWAIKFKSTTTFDVLGENLGLIASGDTSTDLAPLNPATSQPYFTLYAAGWGGGWVSGNALRFNTASANHPLWVVRTTLQGPVTEPNDEFIIQIRGDAD